MLAICIYELTNYAQPHATVTRVERYRQLRERVMPQFNIIEYATAGAIPASTR